MRWKSLASVLALLIGLLGSTTPAVYAASGDWPTYQSDNGRSGYNGSETMITPSTAPHLKLHSNTSSTLFLQRFQNHFTSRHDHSP